MNLGGRSKLKSVVVAIVGLFLLLIIIGAATGGGNTKTKTAAAATTSTSTLRASERPTDSQQSSGDAQAETDVNEALRVIARQDEIFHNYDLVTTFTLGNLDHRLKSIKTLKASSTKTTYSVAVTAPSGTIFKVQGTGRKLARTCAPSSGLCRAGRWAGPSTLTMPRIPVLTAHDKAAVRSLLLASIGHYAGLLSQGQQILGTTQYSSAQAGLRAFSDPHSTASRFSTYQKNPAPQKGPELPQSVREGPALLRRHQRAGCDGAVARHDEQRPGRLVRLG